MTESRTSTTGTAPGPGGPTADQGASWTDLSRVVLTPVAAPSILGLHGFFAVTLLIGSDLAGWWGAAAFPGHAGDMSGSRAGR